MVKTNIRKPSNGNKRKNKANKKKQFTPTRLRDDSAAVEMAPMRNNR